MWVHSNPLMSHACVTFISPPVVTPPPVAKSVSFTGYIAMLWVRPLEMCLDPYKNWIQVDPVFEFLKLLLCCDVALSSPIQCTMRMYYSTVLLSTVLRSTTVYSAHRLYYSCHRCQLYCCMYMYMIVHVQYCKYTNFRQLFNFGYIRHRSKTPKLKRQ